MLYLDTNIFLYLSDRNSPNYPDCVSLINKCEADKTSILTSTETVQEIIHYAKNTKQLSGGVVICKNVLKLVDRMLPIKKKTIEIYIEKVGKYESVNSRDLIHLAVCVENEINTLVTYDKHFSKFKEVKSLSPKDILHN